MLPDLYMSANAVEFEYPKYVTPGNTDEPGKISFSVKWYKLLFAIKQWFSNIQSFHNKLCSFS